MNKVLTALYILASVVDFGVTVYGIILTSFKVEFNPIARSILVNGGIVGLTVFKFGGMTFAIAVLSILVYITWDEPRMKYLAPALLLLGITISLVGAWSWLPHIVEYR